MSNEALTGQYKKNSTVMIVAGEASGDRHGAELFLALKAMSPEVKGIGMGSRCMREAGIDLCFDASNIGVIGVVEVLRHYREIRKALTLVKKTLREQKPDLLICVDYKEFNYKLAAYAKSCGVKVLFYVSPQVWAWRPGRVKKYGRVIDMMAVIFPFEVPYYERENIPVRYVGHPSVDTVKPKYTKATVRDHFEINGKIPVIGLLPGSRQNEIKRLLPEMLLAAEQIASQLPRCQFMLPQANSVGDELIASYLATATVNVRVVKQEFYDVVQCCDAVLTTSGTATLEIALLEVPMVIVYKLSALTYGLGRLLVNIDFIGLPNIIANQGIVKELIQHEASAENMAREVLAIFRNKQYRAEMCKNLLAVKQQLGEGGGSTTMAKLALEILKP